MSKYFFTVCFSVGLALISGCAQQARGGVAQTAVPESGELAQKKGLEGAKPLGQPVEKSYQIKESRGQLDVQYPYFGVESFDKAVKSTLEDIEKAFRGVLSDPFFSNQNVTMGVDYRIVSLEDGVDILFHVNSYVEGSNHPNDYVKTLSIDLDGNILTPEELLDGADYEALLETASQAVRRANPELKNLNLPDYIKPELEYFRHVLRTGNGSLTVYFDSEVLPHVYGILWAEL